MYSSINVIQVFSYLLKFKFSSTYIPRYLAAFTTSIPYMNFGIRVLLWYHLVFTNTIWLFFLFNSILFFTHHYSIRLIAFDSASLESAISPISSANIMTNIPEIKYKSQIKSFITTLKKKGDVLFPYGHPQFKFIFLLFSYILIYAVDSNHLAIRNSFFLFYSTFFSFLSKISWSIESKAFFKSNKATQLHNFYYYLVFNKLTILYKWTSHPYSGTNPS